MRSRRFLLGLVVSGLFLAVFLYRVDEREMWRALAAADYLYVLPALLLYVISLFWRTLRWRLVLEPLGRFRFGRIWPVLIVGYAANNVLPVRLGELVRAYWFWQREGVSKTAVLATILVERTFDGLALLFLVAVSALFLPVVALLRELGAAAHIPWLLLVSVLSLPFFLIGAGMASAALWPASAERVGLRLAWFLPHSARPGAEELVLRLLAGFGVLRDPRRVLATFLLSVSVWLSEAGLYFLISLGFGLDASFDSLHNLAGVLLVTTATSNLGTAIPSTGAGIGPFEFFAQTTLLFFAVAPGVASAYVVVVHAALVVPVTVLGLAYLATGHLSLQRLAAEGVKPEGIGERRP